MDTVLIAEDDLKLQKFLRFRLEKQNRGFQVIVVSNGEEAINVLKHREISLLVTDIQMPKLDGLALLAYMNDKHPDIPCIVLTAHATPEMRSRLSGEIFRFFQKPFQLDDLLQAIDQALEGDFPGGCLRGISVASFLQMIQMDQKTCLLEVACANGEKGLCYFEEGELCDASYQGLRGEEAAIEIIPMEKVKIRFRNTPKDRVEKRIQTELLGLIMEAMRRKDELNGQSAAC